MSWYDETNTVPVELNQTSVQPRTIHKVDATVTARNDLDSVMPKKSILH